MAEPVTRIYLVKSTQTAKADVTRLVRAVNGPQALRHVVDSYFTCELASPDELISATKANVEVENAKNGSAT
jgi:hypothetical protein